MAVFWAATIVERDKARQDQIEEQTLARNRERHRSTTSEYNRCRRLVGGWRAIGRNYGIPFVDRTIHPREVPRLP